jgi:hypothetical protein
MKHYLNLFFIVVFSILVSRVCSSQASSENFITPERQISFAREKKSHTYYVRQAELWLNEIKKDYHSENNWFNYYRACRNAQGTADWKEDFVKESPALKPGNQIVDSMKLYIPNTFTYYFTAGSTGGVESSKELLMKAYQMNPDFEGIHATIATLATSTFDSALRKEVNIRWFKRNEISISLLNYAYNVLASLEPNAIILTEHDNDTYPLWMLQDAKDIRTDVTVINIDFLLDENYRNKVFQKLNIKPIQINADLNIYAENWAKVVHHFLTSYQTDRPLYVALTLSPHRYDGLEKKLYVSGLALLYSSSPINTALLNKNIFENKFLLDYIDKSFYYDKNAENINLINLNYLRPLRICYDYYKRQKQYKQQEKVEKLVSLIIDEISSKEEKLKTTNSFYSNKKGSRQQ